MTFAVHARQVSAPAEMPVSLAEAKAQCRVTEADEDTLIEGLIEAATAHLDGWDGVLSRALVSQGWEADYARLASPLILPLRPVSAVASVTYIDADDQTQTLAADQWRLVSHVDGAQIEAAPGVTWPQTAMRSDAVTVAFTAGYGAAGDVPAPLRHAILMLVHDLFEHRGPAVIGATVTSVPFAVDSLIAPFRRAAF